MFSWIQFFVLPIFWLPATYTVSFADFSTVQKLNAYFEQNFFAQEASITEKQWFTSLPTNDERVQIKELLKRLYQLSNEENFCKSFIMNDYKELSKSCAVTLFKDVYCVVHERDTSRRYWGYAIIAQQKAVKRNLHHSVAHFQSDGDVCNEGAAIFERTNSKALVVNGANRYAVIGNGTNHCQPKTMLADAAHNNQTMFQAMNEAIFEASANFNDAVFIQWHGMAETSCSSLATFISAGLTYSAPTYQDPSSPVNKLTNYYNKLSSGASMPNPRSSCHLVGTTNIFGRYVNGVPLTNLCRQFANNTVTHGMFVHIEQKARARDNWDLWTNVINKAFVASSSSLSFIATEDSKVILDLEQIYNTRISPSSKGRILKSLERAIITKKTESSKLPSQPENDWIPKYTVLSNASFHHHPTPAASFRWNKVASVMTIAYNHRISKASPLNFFRVLLRWKASIWKAVLVEVILWLISYQLIAYIYRLLPGYLGQRFQKFALNINERVKFIPLQFILGFFVNIIVKRWTDAFQNMGRIEDQAILINNIILGDDEETRMLRRTIVRYLCLSQVLVLRDISIRVRRRFPTYESIIKAGYMNKDEYEKFKKYQLREDYNNGRYWAPLNWAFTLVIQARKDGIIKTDIWTAKLCDNSMQVLCNYDWVQIPLAYPQFVFLAVHSFFIMCLFGRQFEVITPLGSEKFVVHIPFPIMTALQYMCYLGWMKVAASLMNPYGEDEDDFECNYLIDKNTATAMCIVDAAHGDLPELHKDKFWEKSEVELFYPIDSRNSVHHPLIGSAIQAKVAKADQEPEMIVVHRPVLPRQSTSTTVNAEVHL